MEIIIAPVLDKIPKRERIKTPFFYAINRLKKDQKFFRICTKKNGNLFGPHKYVYISKLERIFSKNNNIYNVSTRYKKSNNLDSSLKNIKEKSRSLDFYYFFFLGYYELKDNQDNYIRFLKEYLYFYFEYIKQTINFFNSDKFKKNFTKNINNTKLKYIKNNFDTVKHYIEIPSLLKCPDIGKFVIAFDHYYLLYYNLKEKNLNNFLNFNNIKIKECFENKNLNNFLNIKKLESDLIVDNNSDSIINFLNSYGNTSKIFEENSNVLDGEYNFFDEECIDHYYYLFDEKYTLKELFEKAFKDLIKEGYSF